jgi:hypothetical protein
MNFLKHMLNINDFLYLYILKTYIIIINDFTGPYRGSMYDPLPPKNIIAIIKVFACLGV